MKNIIKKYKDLPTMLKAAFWFLICGFLQRGISVITTPVFTRLLNTSEFGEYNVFNSWLGLFIYIIPLVLPSGVYTTGLIKFDKDKKVFSSTLQGLALCLVLFWVVVYTVLHNFWNNLLGLNTLQVIFMFLLIWSSTAYGFWETEQRVENNYKSLVLITVFVIFAKPILSILLIKISNDKVTARILGIVIVQLLAYTGLFVYQIKEGKKLVSLKYWKYALAFNIPLVPHYISQSILNSADRIMIDQMIGSADAGIYSLAYSVSQLMRVFDTAIISVISPWIYQKIKDNEITAISNLAYACLCVMAFLNLALIAFAPEIIHIFAPPDYYNAIWILPPVAMSTYFIFMYNFFSYFEFYFEKTKMIMVATVMSALLNIILNYCFISLFGYMAAAYTTLICYICYSLFHYIAMKKICKHKLGNTTIYNMKTIMLISVVFLILGFLLMFTYSIPYLRYIFILVMAIILFTKRELLINHIKQLLTIRKNMQNN